MMPKLTGEEAIVKLREISVVPIIILSAKSEDTDKIFGLNIGADDYIQKPFSPMELIARVKSNIRRFYAYDLKNERNFREYCESKRFFCRWNSYWYQKKKIGFRLDCVRMSIKCRLCSNNKQSQSSTFNFK